MSHRHLWIAAVGVVVVVLVVLFGGVALTRDQEPGLKFCTADGFVGPGGPWHRDIENDCRWTNEDGDVYTDADGNVTN